MSAYTILAARVPNPATACVDRSDGRSVVVAAQGCIAPMLRLYPQTDYVIFKVQKDPSNNHDIYSPFLLVSLEKLNVFFS